MSDPNNGTVHVMEEEMRDAGVGVFEAKSGPRRRKAETSPENKMDSAPANKAAPAKRKAR